MRVPRTTPAGLLAALALAGIAAPATARAGDAFGGCSNRPALSARMPGQAELPLQGQPEMNCFAWREFIALNWRADPTTCTANPAAGPATFGDPDYQDPVVWQTYKRPNEVFLPDAKPPPPWCSVNRARTDDRLAATSELSTATDETLDAIAQASGPYTFLTAQSGRLTLYEQHMNHDEFAYVDAHGLYNRETQQRFVKDPGIDLPDAGLQSRRYGRDGAIELKAAWLELDDPHDWPRYLTMKAQVVYPGQPPRTVTVGLVGLHIIRKLPKEQQLVWATFEHVDNAPYARDAAALRKPHTYYDPHCDPARCRVNAAPDSRRDPLDVPNQVERIHGLDGNGVVGLNRDVHDLIARANPSSVFRNYELVNVLWPNASTPVKRGATVPLPADMMPAETSDPVANVTLETYVQYDTCTSCHAYATVAGSRTLASDYSFMLGHAKSPPAQGKAVPLVAAAGAAVALGGGTLAWLRRRRRRRDPPTWDGAVAALFGAPDWIDAARRAQVAAEWRSCMTGYGIDLADWASVRASAQTIYDHLASGSMPLTPDTTQRWPRAAVETLAAWIAAGCPQTAADPPPRSLDRLPALAVTAASETPGLRIRRDVLDLGEEELAHYRAALEDVGATDLQLDNPWQQLGSLHADWCLHYQEAFLLWHRASLLLFERMTGVATPYWNFMSPDAPVDGRPGSGLPQPFKDLTYVHPRTGETRPNPLRFAVAQDARSKACRGGGGVDGVDCRYVQRHLLLYTEGDDRRAERERYLAMLAGFQAQVRFASSWPRFSTPEGDPGYPWANLPDFHPPQPDGDYPHRTDFDGLLEQPHDNFHGWFGFDMADNACTGFDPLFWSLHAGIDRVFEQWKRAHPAAAFTSDFPLRPFVGPRADRIAPASPDVWRSTTIGDMARDSRALGYDFAPAAAPRDVSPASATAQGRAAEEPHLYVLFPGVRCMHDSYAIDVFLDLPDPTPAAVHGKHFAGRVTRLGMGVEDTRGRCVRHGVTRVLHTTGAARALGLSPGDAVRVSLLVTDLSNGEPVAQSRYEQWPGFAPVVRWGSSPDA